MPAEAIRINRRVLLQCSIGAPGLKQPFAQPQQNGALVRTAVVREQRSEGLQPVVMPSVPAGMNFTLQLQLLCALPLHFLRDVLFLSLAAFAQRGNAISERLPVDPSGRGPQPRRQIVRSLSF